MELPSYVVPVWMKGRSETWYKCMLCDPVTPYGNSMDIQRHLSSSFHNKIRMQQESFFCKVCDLQCKSKSKYQRHVNGIRHKEKETPLPKSIVELKCDFCSVSFTCKADETRHLATTKHAKNVAKMDSSSSANDRSVPTTV